MKRYVHKKTLAGIFIAACLVSSGCCNKVPKTGGGGEWRLSTTDLYFSRFWRQGVWSQVRFCESPPLGWILTWKEASSSKGADRSEAGFCYTPCLFDTLISFGLIQNLGDFSLKLILSYLKFNCLPIRTIAQGCELLAVHFSVVLGHGEGIGLHSAFVMGPDLCFSEIPLKSVVPVPMPPSWVCVPLLWACPTQQWSGNCQALDVLLHSTMVPRCSVLLLPGAFSWLLSNLPFHPLSHILSKLE